MIKPSVLPSAYNLLELYRQHRDEIDSITDPTSLFILAFTNHLGRTNKTELASDLGVSTTVLQQKLAPLVHGQFVTETPSTLVVTVQGQRLLEELGFLTPPIPPTKSSEPPKQPPKFPAPPAASTPSWLWGIITFLGAGVVVLIAILVVGGFFLKPALLPPTPPTLTRFITTSTPLTTPTFTSSPSPTPSPTRTETASPTWTPTLTTTPTETSIPTPTATSTNTPTRTPTATSTPTPSFTPSRTPTRTRTPTPDRSGPPAPFIVSPKNNVTLNCRQPSNTSIRQTVILDWNAPFDPNGIKNYRVRLQVLTSGVPDPGAWDPVLSTQLNATSSTQCGTAYRWRLLARDNAGNDGAISDWAYFEINPAPVE